MTGLSRCGRQYPNLARALLAAELRAAKSHKAYVATGCEHGDHWHVVLNANANGKQYRPDPFPPAIRQMLVKRDECCQRCGATHLRLEAHHRRAKASGGSTARAHTQCACNGVLLCRKCHEWVHLNPRKSRVEGWIVPQSVSKPGSVGFEYLSRFRYTREAYDRWQVRGGRADEYVFPTCEGTWNDQP